MSFIISINIGKASKYAGTENFTLEIPVTPVSMNSYNVESCGDRKSLNKFKCSRYCCTTSSSLIRKPPNPSPKPPLNLRRFPNAPLSTAFFIFIRRHARKLRDKIIIRQI